MSHPTSLKLTSSMVNEATTTNQTTSPEAQPSIQGEEGKIFGSLSDPLIEDEILKWPSLGHLILERLSNQFRDTVIFIDYKSKKSWTGKEVHNKVLNVATALVDVYQFKPNTAVCINYHNADICTIMALGVIVAGGIVACAYPKDPYQELLYMARKIEPKFLFCAHNQLGWATKLEADMGYPLFGIEIGGKSNEQHLQFQHIEHLLDYDHTQSKALRQLPVACLDTRMQPALILMSSGTTGKPKAVPATHWSCIVDMLRFNLGFDKYKSVIFASAASLDYVSGRLLQFGAIAAGFKVVLLEEFVPETFLDAIQRYAVNTLYLGAASFYNLITCKTIDDYDLSSLRIVFPMGAKVVYLDEMRKFLDKHPNILCVRQGYGTSEFCGAAYASFTPEQYLKDPDNCSKLIPGCQAKVIDPISGKRLGYNQIGMIHVKSMSLFPGYYDIQEMHRRQRKRLLDRDIDVNSIEPVVSDPTIDSPYVADESVFDEEGYYITGDLGYFTNSEDLYMIGRQKELMSCRGAKKVLPQELEETISESNYISKVCVLGIPKRDEPLLSCPRAFVVPKDCFYGMNLSECKRFLEELHQANGKDSDDSNNNSDRSFPEARAEEHLEHRGTHKLSRLDDQVRQLIAEDLMAFMNKRVGWEKQLSGGIVILDDIPILRETGKMNKSYLRGLTLDEISVYGDLS